MIFSHRKCGELDMREVHQELHDEYKDAAERHEYICEHIEEFVPREEEE